MLHIIDRYGMLTGSVGPRYYALIYVPFRMIRQCVVSPLLSRGLMCISFGWYCPKHFFFPVLPIQRPGHSVTRFRIRRLFFLCFPLKYDIANIWGWNWWMGAMGFKYSDIHRSYVHIKFRRMWRWCQGRTCVWLFFSFTKYDWRSWLIHSTRRYLFLSFRNAKKEELVLLNYDILLFRSNTGLPCEILQCWLHRDSRGRG